VDGAASVEDHSAGGDDDEDRGDKVDEDAPPPLPDSDDEEKEVIIQIVEIQRRRTQTLESLKLVRPTPAPLPPVASQHSDDDVEEDEEEDDDDGLLELAELACTSEEFQRGRERGHQVLQVTQDIANELGIPAQETEDHVEEYAARAAAEKAKRSSRASAKSRTNESATSAQQTASSVVGADTSDETLNKKERRRRERAQRKEAAADRKRQEIVRQFFKEQDKKQSSVAPQQASSFVSTRDYRLLCKEMASDDRNIIGRVVSTITAAVDADMVARALIDIACLYESPAMVNCILHYQIEFEISNTERIGTMFRSNSLASKMLSYYARKVGAPYLQRVLRPLLHTIAAADVSCEIDPHKLSSSDGASAEENLANLTSLTQMFLLSITRTLSQIPVEIQAICRDLYYLVSAKFPDPSGVGIAVGGFFFLRFVIPAIVSPLQYNLVDEAPSPSVRRNLVMIAKLIQTISNHLRFSVKEEFMMQTNPFLETIEGTVHKFLFDIVESTEAKENVFSPSSYQNPSSKLITLEALQSIPLDAFFDHLVANLGEIRTAFTDFAEPFGFTKDHALDVFDSFQRMLKKIDPDVTVALSGASIKFASKIDPRTTTTVRRGTGAAPVLHKKKSGSRIGHVSKKDSTKDHQSDSAAETKDKEKSKKKSKKKSSSSSASSSSSSSSATSAASASSPSSASSTDTHKKKKKKKSGGSSTSGSSSSSTSAAASSSKKK